MIQRKFFLLHLHTLILVNMFFLHMFLYIGTHIHFTPFLKVGTTFFSHQEHQISMILSENVTILFYQCLQKAWFYFKNAKRRLVWLTRISNGDGLRGVSFKINIRNKFLCKEVNSFLRKCWCFGFQTHSTWSTFFKTVFEILIVKKSKIKCF